MLDDQVAISAHGPLVLGFEKIAIKIAIKSHVKFVLVVLNLNSFCHRKQSKMPEMLYVQKPLLLSIFLA